MKGYVVSKGRMVWDIETTRDALEDWRMEQPERIIYAARSVQFTWVGEGTTEPTDGPRPARPGDILRLYFALKEGAKPLPTHCNTCGNAYGTGHKKPGPAKSHCKQCGHPLD